MTSASSPPEIQLRAATPDDVPLILSLIRELAEFERLQVVATEELLREHLFGASPAAETILAELEGEAVGYAVYFTRYSTFAGRAGIYLEDLYVQPRARGLGIGRKLLAEVARVAVDRGCSHLDWAVLDWNERAIRFYQSLGARPNAGWTQYRLLGPELLQLAGKEIA